MQATGIINGYAFYFRARYDSWTFAISENKEIDPVDIQTLKIGKKYGFFAEEHLGIIGGYEASYMDTEKVKEIIINSTNQYIAASK